MPSHDAMRPRERVPWQRPPIAGWQGRTGTPPGGGMWDNIPDISKATTHLYADKNQVTTTGLAQNNARTAFYCFASVTRRLRLALWRRERALFGHHRFATVGHCRGRNGQFHTIATWTIKVRYAHFTVWLVRARRHQASCARRDPRVFCGSWDARAARRALARRRPGRDRAASRGSAVARACY